MSQEGSSDTGSGSSTNNPDRQFSASVDLSLSYEEAVERDDFQFARVFTTEGEPTDADIGQLKMDFDEPDTKYLHMIYSDEQEPTLIKEASVSKIGFPKNAERPEDLPDDLDQGGLL